MKAVVNNMMVDIKRFEFVVGEYIYTAHRRNHRNSHGWTLMRLHEDKANIPPCTEQLTSNGWEITAISKGEVVVFLSEADAVGFAESGA